MKGSNRTQRSHPAQRPDIEHPVLSGRPDLGLLLAIAARTYRDAVQETFETAGFHGLRPAHTYTLHALHRQSMTPGQLASYLHVTKPAAGKVIDELRRLGYVRIAVDPKDRRRSLITLTDRGRLAWEAGSTAGAELEEWLTKTLGRKGASARVCLLAIARRFESPR
jgi:DNA-binding MarR family transcriptional regulator